MKFRQCLILLFSIGSPALATAQVAPEGLSSQYAVGIGDVLLVTVYHAPDYGGTVEVGEDGTIILSTIGKVKVGGLTAQQAGGEIAGRLESEGIFRKPLVNVMVQTYRSRTVFVLGSVGKPGEYPLERGNITITQMLARAGATLGVGGGTIRLVHGDGKQEDIAASDILAGSQNQFLQPRDSVIVTETATFYISGEVMKPGTYPLEPGLTMDRAIALAGGVTQRGARSRLKVTRYEADGERIIKPKPNEQIKARDLIDVGSRIF